MPAVQTKSISCPNCGGPVQLRGFAHTLTVVCPQCSSILDASTPEVQILQKFEQKTQITPTIPLGSRGKIGGTQYEVIGFQIRQVAEGEDNYTWNEYLLFNPYHGFRYLTEYNGHWNFVHVETALPEQTRARGKVAVRYEGKAYLAFDSMTAQTVYVLGEFPWRVQVGESVACQDFVAPPSMLSAESTGGEITWSLAEYMSGAQIWQAFKLPGSPPRVFGVFANQPSPYGGSIGSAWRTWLWLNVALAALMLFFMFISPGRVAYSDHYAYSQANKGNSAFVTPTFQLKGRESNVELSIHTDLDNNWAYFNFALINDQTGQTFDFAREVSYYHDSDGIEGSRNNSVIIPGVPSGQYYLRVEPEMETNSAFMSYQLELRRNVPNFALFGIAALLLLIPPIVTTFRRGSFEAARWRESDFAASIAKAGASA
ncbi:MAG TPA: DUF4178 domain-containing protein [Bryobacteraceae bacterium]|nr:DUF4178 domain-containing protein [Bryobacteraceae bacterium]